MPKAKIETRRQISAGGVIFKPYKSSVKVCLLAREEGKIWCLPKGLVEKGESSSQAALREIEEETGLKGRLIKKIDSINYWYYSQQDKIRYFKIVHFFLFRYIKGSTKTHDYETEESKWFDINQALKIITYKTEKDIVKKARGILKQLTARDGSCYLGGPRSKNRPSRKT